MSEALSQLVYIPYFGTVRIEKTPSAWHIEPHPEGVALPDDRGKALYYILKEEALPDTSLWQGTPFQRSVWHALSVLPMGARVSYQEIAVRIGKPRAVRAVANAVGANPFPLLIPCHRVIRSSGAIGGYYYGTAMKEALLRWEAEQMG